MRNFEKLRLITSCVLTCLIINLSIRAQMPGIAQVDDGATSSIDTSDNGTILIGDVSLTGYRKTKPYIIQREVAFTTGESITRSSLAKKMELSRQQLMNTSLFVDVEVKSEFIARDIVLINIDVKERWYIFPELNFKIVDRNFNTWWVTHKRSLQRINYGLKFSHNNLTGRNDKLNLWLVGGFTRQVSVRYENPFLEKSLKHGLNVGFSYSRNRELVYNTFDNKDIILKLDDQYAIKRVHADLAYSYRPAIKTRHIFRLAFSDITLNDSVTKRNSSYFPGGSSQVKFIDFNYNIKYFNVDYIIYPLKGFSGEAYIYKRFGKKYNLWQLGGKSTYTFPVLPKTYLQFQAAGLIRLPYNQPYFNLRMFGSSDLYMRGLEYYVIDGVAGGILRSTAIQRVLNLNLPNPFKVKTLDKKIPIKAYFKTYTDLGYSYHPNPGNSVFNNKLLRTWGFGIDIVTIYDVVLKFEYSFNQLGGHDFYLHSKSDF